MKLLTSPFSKEHLVTTTMKLAVKLILLKHWSKGWNYGAIFWSKVVNSKFLNVKCEFGTTTFSSTTFPFYCHFLRCHSDIGAFYRKSSILINFQTLSCLIFSIASVFLNFLAMLQNSTLEHSLEILLPVHYWFWQPQ